MEVSRAIKERRSVRKFKSEDFSEETLTLLLEAASLAPSAGNVQPWKFYIIRDKKFKEKLGNAALGQRWMTSAPVIIVVCADLERSALAYGERGYKLYALQDTAAAIQNILLSAVEQGLSSCWVGAFREEMAADLLDLDIDKLRPVALVPIGYPAESPLYPPKRPLKEIVEYK